MLIVTLLCQNQTAMPPPGNEAQLSPTPPSQPAKRRRNIPIDRGDANKENVPPNKTLTKENSEVCFLELYVLI